MNGNQLEANATEGVRTIHRTKLITQFSGYLPTFDVTSLVYRMLESVPEDYLNGLNAVVLTNTSCLSRERLKRKTKSRKRKVGIAQALGLYHQAWNGETAWIEIFVDQTLKNSTKGRFKPPFEKEWLLAHVLFHEIGHHIHAVHRPVYEGKENVAEDWSGYLSGKFYRRRYWYAQPILYPLWALVRLLKRR